MPPKIGKSRKQQKRKNNLDEAENIDKMVSKAFLIH
jgi:hypothetical protein